MDTAGGQELIRAIEEYRSQRCIRIFQNVPRTEFVNTLRQAACLIGNSSLGFLEAPFLKLPAINVGNRQKGRLHGDNVMFVPHDRKAIVAAINKACFDTEFIQKVQDGFCPYGDGQTSRRVVEILSTIELGENLLTKTITYE